MAQLKDSLVQGSLRVTDTIYTNELTVSDILTANKIKTTNGIISYTNDSSSAFNMLGLVFSKTDDTIIGRIGMSTSQTLGIYAGGTIFIRPNSASAASAADGVKVDGNGLAPTVTNTEDLGTSSLKWKNVYATTFNGALSGNADTATSAGKWTTACTLTIGNKGQSVNGSANVSWGLQDILIRAGNEFNFTADGIESIHFNHKTQSGTSATTAIKNYYFKNGSGATTGVTIYAATFSGALSGTASNATTTAETANALYPVGVTSDATTTLKRDTSITMTGGDLTVGNSTSGSLFVGTATASTAGTGERQLGVKNGSGRLYLYAANTITGNKGLYSYATNQSTGGAIITVNQSNQISALATITSTLTLHNSIPFVLSSIQVPQPYIRWDTRAGTSAIGTGTVTYQTAAITTQALLIVDSLCNKNTYATAGDTTSNVTVTRQGPRFRFRQYSRKSTAIEKVANSRYEEYILPATNEDRTSSSTYDILTSKNTITVAQGGTGLTKANANVVFAGPSSGSAAAPSWRALVAADIPAVSKTTAGLCPILPNETTTTKFLRQDGNWEVPAYIANAAYGNITTAGAVGQTSGWTLASGDALVVCDSNNSNKLERTGITFDGSTETKALTPKGTWVTFNNYSHPTSAGNKHIPSGGSTGQFLKYSSSGTAAWSDLPSYGNITTAGAVGQTSSWALGSGDALVVCDSNNSNKLERTGITFDGSTETKALTPKGTWVTFNNYSHPTSAGNKHIPSGGSTGQFLKYSSSGTAAWSDLPSYGNLSTDGKITTAITIAANDYIIIGDNSDNGKIGKGPIFDASTTTTCLTQKGTWVTFCDLTSAQTFTGNKTFKGVAYFANGTTYYVGTTGNAKFNTLTAAGAATMSSTLSVTGVASFTNTTGSTSTSSGAVKISGGLGVAENIYGLKVYNAVWNDYAECRNSWISEPGRVITEDRSGTMELATQRLMPACKVISDTYGTLMGESETAKTPIAVAGRVLVYPYKDRAQYQLGDAVCSAPNGTVDIMSRDEIMMFPERIIGTVSEIPSYEVWHAGTKDNPTDIEVNGRIWIYVR